MSDSASGWPGPDENHTIDEMIAQPDSPYWADCDLWIEVIVAALLSDVQESDRDVIANNVKHKVRIGLPGFRRHSKLTTWIFGILNHEKIDFYRRGKPQRNEASLEALEEEYGHLEFIANDHISQHEFYHDLVRRVLEAARKFALTRKDPKRAVAIIQLWLEGTKPAEIADLLGIKPQIVSNTLYLLRRQLQHFAAEWFGETDSPDPPDID